MANRFWVGGAGTWDSATTTHWSATTGGAGGASVPIASDDVLINGSSGLASLGFVTTSGAVVCRSVTTAGQTAGGLKVNTGTSLSIGDASGGTLTIDAGNGVFSNLGTINMISTTTGNTVTGGGFSLGNIVFNGVGGAWTAADALAAGAITHTAGTINLGTALPIAWTSYTFNGTTAATLSLSASATNVITTFIGSGTLGNVLTVNSAAAGTTATLSSSKPSTICSFLSVRDITVTGGTRFTAYDSIDLGHNTNVQFLRSATGLANFQSVSAGDGMSVSERIV